MVEVSKEFKGLMTDHPISAEELTKNKKQQVLELAGTWETMGSVSGSISEIVRYGLPGDYFNTYTERMKSLELPDVKKATDIVLEPDKMIWVVVGDLSKIESGIRELNLGEVHYIDADGNLIERASAATK
jgi:zinc protease